MADVFVSYSRRDIAFARLLHDALKQSNLETWIDWQDIPPSADWLAEVYEAIEQADTFVFVISPHSVGSEICGLEVAHAAKNSKRLIPIVVNDIDPNEVSASLAALNWIFFREDEEFSAAFQSLTEAIRVDQAWVKEHTRLQVRALEWERKNCDNSYSLRGKDLEQAEQWLSRAAEKDPKPSVLQTQYVLASRRTATRRQRVTLGAVLTGLVVAVALSIVAWTQRNQAVHEGHVRATAQAEAVAESHARATAQAEAEEQRRVATEQRDVAISRQLAAQALTRLDDQLDLALLLSVEASLIDDNPESRSSLLTGLTYRPYLKRFLLKDVLRVTYSVAFSPDGGSMATGHLDGTTILRDATTGQQLGEPLTGHTERVRSVAFSPDGRLLAAYSDDTVILWDMATGQPFGQPLTNCGTPLAFSPDGELLASSGRSRGTIILWDVASGQPISQSPTGDWDWVNSMAFSPDGEVLALGSHNGEITLWDVAAGQPIGEPLTGHEGGGLLAGVTSLAFSPDGKTLASGGSHETFLWDVASGQPAHHLTDYDAEVSVTFSHDGQPIAFVHRDDRIILWDARSGELIGGQSDLGFLRGEIKAITVSPDGRSIVSSSDFRFIGTIMLLWDVEARYTIQRPIEGSRWVRSVAFSPLDGDLLASGGCRQVERVSDCSQGEIRFWDVTTGQAAGTSLTGHTDWVTSIAFGPDGRMLASGSLDNTVILWDIATGQPIGQPLTGHDNEVWSVAFSPDGTILASSAPDAYATIILWDVATQQPIGLPIADRISDGYVRIGPYQVIFSPDGEILASNGYSLTLRHVPSGQRVSQSLTPSGSRYSGGNPLAFSPDGRTLAAGGVDGIALWDVATGQLIVQPPQDQMDPPYVESIAFSPDGKAIASSTLDGTIIMWDAATGEAIGPPLVGHTNSFGAVWSVAFSPDGMILASAAYQGEIILWDVSLGAWQDQACHIANRNLTPEEWVAYLSDEPYRRTCPELP